MVGNAVRRGAPLRRILQFPRPAHRCAAAEHVSTSLVSPYLYRDEEIRRLLEAAWRLPPVAGLRRHTYATLFGLYVATGLRTSEPLRLDRDDVDLVHGVLTIRDTKFGKYAACLATSV